MTRPGWAGDWYREVMALDTSKTPDLAAAQKLIGQWDWTLDCKGPADTLVTTAFAQAARFAYMNKPRPDTAAALREAVDLLHDALWPARCAAGAISSGCAAATSICRCVAAPKRCAPSSARRRPMAAASATMAMAIIMLIEWAPGGGVSSSSVHQFGAATVRTQSPHYADQSPLFAAEKWKQLDFDGAGAAK